MIFTPLFEITVIRYKLNNDQVVYGIGVDIVTIIITRLINLFYFVFPCQSANDPYVVNTLWATNVNVVKVNLTTNNNVSNVSTINPGIMRKTRIHNVLSDR